MDPYSRVPRSPKSKNQQPRPVGLEGLSQPFESQECKSPVIDQVRTKCLESGGPNDIRRLKRKIVHELT